MQNIEFGKLTDCDVQWQMTNYDNENFLHQIQLTKQTLNYW